MRRSRGTDSNNDKSDHDQEQEQQQHQKHQNDNNYHEIAVPENTSSSVQINRKNNNNATSHHTDRVLDKNEAATLPIEVDGFKSDEHGNNLRAEQLFRHQQPLAQLKELYESLEKIGAFSKQIANGANLQEGKKILEAANITITRLQRHGLANLIENNNDTNISDPYVEQFAQIFRFIIASSQQQPQEQNANNTNNEKFLRFFDEPDLCVGSFHYKRDDNYSSPTLPGQTQEQDLLGAIRRSTIYGGLLTSRQFGPCFIQFLTLEQQRYFFGKVALQDLFDKYPKELADHQQLLANYDERHDKNNNSNNNNAENPNTASAYEEALAIVHAALKGSDSNNLVTVLLGQTNEKVMPLQLRHVLFEASGGYGLPHRVHVLDIKRSNNNSSAPGRSQHCSSHAPSNQPTAKEFHNDTLFLVCDRRDVAVFQEIINKRIQFDECGAWLARTFIATGMLHILDSISRRTEVAEYFPKVYHLTVDRHRRLYRNHHALEEQFVGTCEQLFNPEVLGVLQKCAILKRPKRPVTIEVLQESKQKNSGAAAAFPPSSPQVLSPLLDIPSEIEAGCTKLTLPTLLFALVHKFLLRKRIELAQAERAMNPYCDTVAAINNARRGHRSRQIPPVAAATPSFRPAIPIESEGDLMPHAQAPTHANTFKLTGGQILKNIFTQQAYDNYMSEGSSKFVPENHGQPRNNNNNGNRNNNSDNNDNNVNSNNNNNPPRLLHQIASEALCELSRRINLDDILAHICASPTQQLSNVQRCGGVCPMIRVNNIFFSPAICSSIDYVHEHEDTVRQKEAQMMPVIEYLDDRRNFNFFQMMGNNNGHDDGSTHQQQPPLRVIPLVDPICLEAELPNCKPIARFMQKNKNVVSGPQRSFYFNNNGYGNNNHRNNYNNNNNNSGYSNNNYHDPNYYHNQQRQQ